MSTCNFAQPNLSYVYAFGDDIDDDIGWDFAIDDIKNCLSDIKGFYLIGDRWLDRDRKVIGGFDFEYYDKDYSQWDLVTIYITCQSGYYAGAMVDADFDEWEGIEQTKTVQKKIDAKMAQVEKVLTKITTPLIRVAVFSNGEGIYEKVTDRSVVKAIARGTI